MFGGDSRSSCKSSAVPLLKRRNNIPFPLLSICLPLPLRPPALILTCSLPAPPSPPLGPPLASSPPLVCQRALLARLASVDGEAPRSLTDGESMTAALSRGPVAHGGLGTRTDEVTSDLMSLRPSLRLLSCCLALKPICEAMGHNIPTPNTGL